MGASFFVAVVMLAGCAPWATYPPIPGAAQTGRADYEPAPSIMAEAIRYTYERHARASLDAEEIVFNLPEGLPAFVYDRVLRRLGDEIPARPMTPGDDHAIHLSNVRVRALDAEVDVIYPRPDGLHEMVMLTMRQEFLNRYRVTGSRLWRIHVAAPPAHYVPPPAKPARRDAELAAAEDERALEEQTETGDAAEAVHAGASPDGYGVDE